MDRLPDSDEQRDVPSTGTGLFLPSLRSTRATAGMVVFLSFVYLYFCSRPIWHTDVWGHLSYGRHIWRTHSFPVAVSAAASAQGIPFVDTPWLSQLIGFAVVSTPRLQLAGLQGLLAVGVTGCGALLWRSADRLTKNGWFSLLAVIVFLAVGWFSLLVLRPQLAGLICFMVILTRVVRRPAQTSDWIVVPVVFALWANLHASFFVGLGLLASCWLGRFFDMLRRTGRVQYGLRDRRVRRLFSLSLLSAAAVLVNPYTIEIYREVIRFPGQENLRDLTEWQPLNMREGQGLIFAAVAMILIVLYRLSPRRVQCWEVIALGGLGFATLTSARMIIWWAPVAALMMAQHGSAVWRAHYHARLQERYSPPSRTWLLSAIGTALICFAISPLGVAVVWGKHAEPRKALSAFTPVFAAEYLNQHSLPGPVFNTFEWGDYLQWAGPPDLQVFLNSHAHLVPRDKWRAYLQVIELRSGWEETLDRYGFNTIIVDRANREALVENLMLDPRWQTPPVEQEGQVIFVRRQPIAANPKSH